MHDRMLVMGAGAARTLTQTRTLTAMSAAFLLHISSRDILGYASLSRLVSVNKHTYSLLYTDATVSIVACGGRVTTALSLQMQMQIFTWEINSTP